MKSFWRLSVLLVLQLVSGSICHAQDNQIVRLSPAIQYQLIARWDVDRLNKILRVDTPAFAGITTEYSPARNAVRHLGLLEAGTPRFQVKFRHVLQPGIDVTLVLRPRPDGGVRFEYRHAAAIYATGTLLPAAP